MPLPRIQTSIINHLVELRQLTEEQADSIINSPDESMTLEAMEKLLIEEYNLTEFKILVAKSKAFDLNPFNAKNYVADERTFAELDKDFCAENNILPVGIVGGYIVVALSDPFNLTVTGKIQEITNCKVLVLLALDQDIQSNIKSKDENIRTEGFGDVVEALGEQFDVDDMEIKEEDLEEEDSPIVQLSSRIVEEAYFTGASDIHIEPFEKEARVRLRVDGQLIQKLTIPPRVCASLMARFKIMANLDIAEKRLPQDGRIAFKQYNRKGIDVDLRVATGPMQHGEGAVMRLLDKTKSTLPLPALGFEEENLEKYREVINRPYGMILHCGPTGSGKSMTLYSALNEINDPSLCIRTAEDPIEYTLQGLCQMQMQPKIGLTFARALRAFLRMDPDIILVGEIRDQETAGIAVEAALTGHLLFSTVHTNDASSTISRLTEMGIEPFMISASLLCVCAQRLMRRVCKTCRQKYIPEGNEAEILQRAIQWAGEIFKSYPGGCPACQGNGYKGRIGIHEMMVNTDELVKGINEGLEAAQIKRIALMGGMATLHQDSMMKVRSGLSTMEESLSTAPPDMEDIQSIKEEFALDKQLRLKKERERKAELAALMEESVANTAQ